MVDHGHREPDAPPTSNEARDLLQQAQRSTITRHRDRSPHATYLAGTGVGLGLLAGGSWAAVDTAWGGLISFGIQLAYLTGLVILVGRRERRVRTVPRGVRRTSLWGIAGTAALGLLAYLPLLHRGAGGIPAGIAIAVVVAAPAVFAAVRVARGPEPR